MKSVKQCNYKQNSVRLIAMVSMIAFINGCAGSSNSSNQFDTSSQSNDSNSSYGIAPHLMNTAQLESLVAPIALYPDPLLSLMLLASTYPLEVAEAYNWQRSNANLKEAQLQNALKAQSWNDSVKSLISFPQSLGMMGNQLQWTQNLGNAFKLQPADTMKAVQTLRKRAVQAGTLKSNAQMTVTTGIDSNVIIDPPNTQIVYVPAYNPTIVYGSWPYPAYPPYPAYNPAWGAMTFGMGLAVGDAFWATPSWSSGTINVNNTGSAGRSTRGIIGPSSIQNQQRLMNDWKNNTTPQDKQVARSASQRVDNDFQKNATPQERTQVDRLNQESRNDAQEDRSNPSAYREAAQENVLRDQARFDSNQDRFGGRTGFGGGRMGGFRR
jgi:hypothetical protein